MRDLWHLCRSPPTNQCANQCANFDELKAHYLQARLGTVTSKEQVSRNKVKAFQKARKLSPNQQKYFSSMKMRMQELAQAGVVGTESMCIAAADWKAHPST